MDDPQRLTERGALLLIRGLSHLALGDVICIRSRPNALLHCRTAAPVLGEDMAPDYALPPNTQLTFEEVREPPWTATMRRWHRGKNESGVYFADEMSRSMTTSRPLTSSLLDRKAARTTLS